MPCVPNRWLPLLVALLTSSLLSCATLLQPAAAERPSCPAPSSEASEEFDDLVWDGRYSNFVGWFGDILEYCWHEELEEGLHVSDPP